MMYALCNYRITNINVGSNILGDETSLSARKLVGEGYKGDIPDQDNLIIVATPKFVRTVKSYTNFSNAARF